MKIFKKIASHNLGNIFKYSLIKYIALGIGFLKGMVNAKFLGPELLGILGNLTLILGYCSYLNLGVLNSMNREFVLYEDNEPNKAKEVVSTAFSYLCLISIGFIILAIGSIVVYNNTFGVYLAIIFIIAITEQFRNFYTNYFRLKNDYNMINIIEILYSIIAFIITIMLINRLEIFGVLVAMLFCGITIILLGIMKVREIKFKINNLILRDLIKVGIPLVIYNLGFHILTTIDRWIIIKFLDDMQLGYYTFASTMVSATLVFITSLLFLLYPKVIKSFNENQSNGIIEKVYSYTKLLEIGSVCLFLVGLICITPFIDIFLPLYHSSIKSYNLLVLAIILNNISYFANAYIVSNKKQKYLVYMQCVSIIMNFTLNLFLVRYGLGIVGIALGTMITNFIYSFMQYSIFIKLNTKKFNVKKVFKSYWKLLLFGFVQGLLVLSNIMYSISIIITIISIICLYYKDITKVKDYMDIVKE